MSIHISNKKVNDIHVGTKKVLSAWVGTDRVYLASTLSMLIKGYTEKSGDSLLSANTPLKFTGENLGKIEDITSTVSGITIKISKGIINTEGEPTGTGWIRIASLALKAGTYYLKDFGLGTNKVKIIDASYTQISNGNSSFTLSYDRTVYYAITGNSIISSGNLINSMPMLVKGNIAPTTFEPYRETFYNPPEGFSLNGFNDIYDTFNTINGELTKRFAVVDLGTANPTSTYFGSGKHQFLYEQLGVKPQTANPANIICSKYPTDMSGKVWADDYGICADTRGIIVQDYNFNDIQTFKEANIGVYAVFELATPQTYQKKPKTLPQWVKHVFDSSGRELEATITQ